MEIYELSNFVELHTCDLIHDWLASHKNFEPINKGCSGFDNRTIPFNKINNVEIKRLVNVFRFNITLEARKLFSELLYPDYTDLVYWPDGEAMNVHADSCWLDGLPNYCAHRYSAAVTYLNDNYKGGETYFPKFNYRVKPQKGKVVLFLADLDHQHGVTSITGNRYTMPIWFTKDKEHLET